MQTSPRWIIDNLRQMLGVGALVLVALVASNIALWMALGDAQERVDTLEARDRWLTLDRDLREIDSEMSNLVGPPGVLFQGGRIGDLESDVGDLESDVGDLESCISSLMAGHDPIGTRYCP